MLRMKEAATWRRMLQGASSNSYRMRRVFVLSSQCRAVTKPTGKYAAKFYNRLLITYTSTIQTHFH